MSFSVSRISSLQKLMLEKDISTCIFFHYTEISFFTESHLGNFLLIPQIGQPIIFTRNAVERIEHLNPSSMIFSYKSYKDCIDIISPYLTSTLALSFSSTSYKEIQRFLLAFSISTEQVIDNKGLLQTVSLIKSPAEVQSIQDAAISIEKAFQTLTAINILGKTESTVSGMLYAQLREMGFIGEQRFFNTTPFTGPAVLTQDSILSTSTSDTTYSGYGVHNTLAIGSGNRIITKNTPFIIDIVNNVSGMYADITRTFIIGEPSLELLKRYDDLLSIFQFIQTEAQLGNTFHHIYLQTLNIVEKMGYKNYFMGLYPHQSAFIGHNIGAWVDESPPIAKNIHTPLQEGMTLAIEPKFYFEDGNSPGIESTFLQTKNGLQRLDTIPLDLRIL